MKRRYEFAWLVFFATASGAPGLAFAQDVGVSYLACAKKLFADRGGPYPAVFRSMEAVNVDPSRIVNQVVNVKTMETDLLILQDRKRPTHGGVKTGFYAVTDDKIQFFPYPDPSKNPEAVTVEGDRFSYRVKIVRPSGNHIYTSLNFDKSQPGFLWFVPLTGADIARRNAERKYASMDNGDALDDQARTELRNVLVDAIKSRPRFFSDYLRSRHEGEFKRFDAEDKKDLKVLKSSVEVCSKIDDPQIKKTAKETLLYLAKHDWRQAVPVEPVQTGTAGPAK